MTWKSLKKGIISSVAGFFRREGRSQVREREPNARHGGAREDPDHQIVSSLIRGR